MVETTELFSRLPETYIVTFIYSLYINYAELPK